MSQAFGLLAVPLFLSIRAETGPRSVPVPSFELAIDVIGRLACWESLFDCFFMSVSQSLVGHRLSGIVFSSIFALYLDLSCMQSKVTLQFS